MRRSRLTLLSVSLSLLGSALVAAGYGFFAMADETASGKNPAASVSISPVEACKLGLSALPGPLDASTPLDDICKSVLQAKGCQSVKGRPIFHWEKGALKSGGKKILVFGLIHGDEGESGTLVRHWLLRLNRITDNRNAWRIVPILNPDGYELKTRANANDIDLNRNFPTKDWDTGAIAYWKKGGANPRRFPGKTAGSEPETGCAIEHIEDFHPDLIVSVHTPYSLIDFDGPNAPLPRVSRHPVRRLGNFPGSLGRYMWADRKIPVLTVELSQGKQPLSLEESERLQDSIGDLANQAVKLIANSPGKPSPQASQAN